MGSESSLTSSTDVSCDLHHFELSWANDFRYLLIYLTLVEISTLELMFVRSSLKSVICCHFIVFSWDAEVAHFAAREGRRLLETTDLVHLHHLIKHRESVSHSSLFYSISLCDFKG